uniref:NADH-ubiquinone oxidoreductase chain 1 n=1 Tax=Limnoria quadripunctata TaxID=161573 RepID=A0A023IWZ5_LIMQU|nr:NADH dehydrogenase subunit 1 [Limnoria quadripunctata]
MIIFMKTVIYIISILMSVAFFTLFERKILGYIQIRKGPNKTSFKGSIQPFSDAVKLILKESVLLKESSNIMYFISPIFSLSVSLITWMSLSSSFGSFEIFLSMVFLLCCLSFNVYSLMSASWASNSKYSMLGGLRAVAQTISYEVSLIIILMSLIILANSFNLYKFNLFKEWFIFMAIPLGVIWLVSSLAETSRTPFDFSESESELVSGFNTEYSSGGFVLFFLAEYSNILFMSAFFASVFCAASESNFVLKLMSISFLFIWVRGTLPRFRYDKLMSLTWKVFLPSSLNYLILFLGIKSLTMI